MRERPPLHGNRAARRTTGLEATLVGKELHDIAALDTLDLRTERTQVRALSG